MSPEDRAKVRAQVVNVCRLNLPPEFRLRPEWMIALLDAADERDLLRGALEEAIEFADQDYHCLTPTGDAMVARWRAALTAALPAPGVEGEWVMVPRVATKVMISRANQQIDWCRSEQKSTYDPSDRHPSGVGSTQADDIQDAYAAMLAAAPPAPGAIPQAQAQAMREALDIEDHARDIAGGILQERVAPDQNITPFLQHWEAVLVGLREQGIVVALAAAIEAQAKEPTP